jgi:hypothetical protein
MPTVAIKPNSKDIYKLFKKGLSHRDIASQLGIGQAQVIIAIRKKQATIVAMQQMARGAVDTPAEKPADTPLKGHQVLSIWDESEVGQSPAHISKTLGIELHDVRRILKDLDEDEGNLQRVVYSEKLGKELFEAIESDLINNVDERLLRNVYGKNLNFQEIMQAICHSSGPSEREWQEHCKRYKLEWNQRELRRDSIEEWPFPRRCESILKNAGIESVERIRNIIDGTDSEFHNLEQIPEVDVDCRDRIMAILNDELDSVLPNTIHYHAPFIEAVEGGPPEKCVVKLTEEPEGASLDTSL